MRFQESKIAHKYLDGLRGLEIGGSEHNSFGLNTLNVDFTDDMDTTFKQGEFQLCGEKMKVDIIANGDDLPFKDNTVDFVLSSHVIEHFFDPIKALKEWYRVVKPGGYVFIIAPKQFSLPGETRDCTKIEELIARHEGRMKPEEVDMSGYQTSTVTGLKLDGHGHWSVWNLPEFMDICKHLGYKVVEALETDDKVKNGFCVILQKT